MNEANKDRLGDTKLPLVFHMALVHNSRLMTVTALPPVARCAQGSLCRLGSGSQSEKAVAIGTWFVTLGIPTHVGVTPK